MEIKNLRNGMRNIEVEFMITEQPKVSFGRENAKFTVVRIDDASGWCKLVLFGDHINMAEIGKKYRIEGGFTQSYLGEMRLGIDKDGKLLPLEMVNA